jgi:hypothetical protein
MDSEDYKEFTRLSKERKTDKRISATNEITALNQSKFKVEKITEYHFRINGKWDLYPTTKKIFRVADSSKFCLWKSGQLSEKLDLLEVSGSISPMFVLGYFSRSGGLIETVGSGDYGKLIALKKQKEKSGNYKMGELKIHAKTTL